MSEWKTRDEIQEETIEHFESEGLTRSDAQGAFQAQMLSDPDWDIRGHVHCPKCNLYCWYAVFSVSPCPCKGESKS